MDDERCPRCGKALLVQGSTSRPSHFRPDELSIGFLTFQLPEVAIARQTTACASCGLIWSEVDVEILRQKLHDLGNDEVKQRLGLLDGESDRRD